MISLDNNKTIASASNDSLDSDHIELTPLIDVIFIVIVFLLLTANARLLSLPVTVPESDDIPQSVSTNQLTVNITISVEDRGWFIDKEHFIEWPEFREKIIHIVNETPEVLIAIAADQQADVQRFVKVLTLLQQQQVANTHIVLKEEK